MLTGWFDTKSSQPGRATESHQNRQQGHDITEVAMKRLLVAGILAVALLIPTPVSAAPKKIICYRNGYVFVPCVPWTHL